MDAIRINVTGAQQAGVRFEEFPDDLYADLKKEIEALSNDLFVGVEANAPEKTGDLRSRVRRRVFTDKDRITGYVDIQGDGKDLAKAGALEHGAHRAHKVDTHRMRLDHFWAVRLAKPVTVIVEAFSRTANLAERAFERRTLEAMRPEVIMRLNAVVERATAKANA
jgi:hypothetical protein